MRWRIYGDVLVLFEASQVMFQNLRICETAVNCHVNAFVCASVNVCKYVCDNLTVNMSGELKGVIFLMRKWFAVMFCGLICCFLMQE